MAAGISPITAELQIAYLLLPGTFEKSRCNKSSILGTSKKFKCLQVEIICCSAMHRALLRKIRKAFGTTPPKSWRSCINCYVSAWPLHFLLVEA